MIEGDVVFDAGLLSALCEPAEGNYTVVEPYRPPLSGSFVEMDERNTVIDWLPAACQPPGFSPCGYFKTVNMTRLAGAAITLAVLPCLEEGTGVSDSGAIEILMRRSFRTGLRHNF